MSRPPLADCLKRYDNISGAPPLARKAGPAGPVSGVKGGYGRDGQKSCETVGGWQIIGGVCRVILEHLDST